MLARAQPELHRVLLRLLAEMANPRAAHHLILRLPRVDKSTRKELLKVMIRMGVPADLLPDMLESTGLPKSITAEVKGMLGELTFHTTPQVRAKLPSLVSQLNHPSGMERLKGLRALNQLQDPGGMRALMVLATSDKEPQIRRESMEGLAVWGDQEATPTFIEALGDESPYIRQLALQLVARYRTSGALPTVRTLLKDKQATVRSLAYHAVALLGADKEIPLLVDGIRDKSFEVRQATMDSLMTMNQKMVVRHLLPMAQGTNGPRLRGRVFRFLARLTQLNLGYYPEATPTQRRQMLGRVQTWLKRSQ
jgi:hypothetical protein